LASPATIGQSKPHMTPPSCKLLPPNLESHTQPTARDAPFLTTWWLPAAVTRRRRRRPRRCRRPRRGSRPRRRRRPRRGSRLRCRRRPRRGSRLRHRRRPRSGRRGYFCDACPAKPVQRHGLPHRWRGAHPSEHLQGRIARGCARSARVQPPTSTHLAAPPVRAAAISTPLVRALHLTPLMALWSVPRSMGTMSGARHARQA